MLPLLVAYLVTAFTMSHEIQMLLIGQLVVIIGGVGKFVWEIHKGRRAERQRKLDIAAIEQKRKSDMEAAAEEREQARLDTLQQREQDRLDSESKARILQEEVINQAKLIAAEGARRESRILDKIDENTAMNAEQIKISNGHKEDIKAAVQTTTTLAKAISDKTGMDIPQEIHVTIDQKTPS